MAYNKEDLEKKALAAIKRYNLSFIDDLCAYLPCSRSTFYEKELDKSDAIKEAINNRKIKAKNGLKDKWYNGNNATTQIALYKLLATPDELRRLQSNYNFVEMTGSNGSELIPSKLEVQILTGSIKPITSEEEITDIEIIPHGSNTSNDSGI